MTGHPAHARRGRAAQHGPLIHDRESFTAALLGLAFGVAAYAVFLATFLYAIAFVAGLPVPRTVDAGGPAEPAGIALAIDLLLLFAQWRPLPGLVWQVHDPAAVLLLQVVQGVGWALVLVSTFLIDHFELFGLRQVAAALRRCESTQHARVAPGNAPNRGAKHRRVG